MRARRVVGVVVTISDGGDAGCGGEGEGLGLVAKGVEFGAGNGVGKGWRKRGIWRWGLGEKEGVVVGEEESAETGREQIG